MNFHVKYYVFNRKDNLPTCNKISRGCECTSHHPLGKFKHNVKWNFPIHLINFGLYQVVGIVTACSLLVVNASHTMIFPSCVFKNFKSVPEQINRTELGTWDEETICRLSDDQSAQRTFAWWPLSTRLGLIVSCAMPSRRWETVDTTRILKK